MDAGKFESIMHPVRIKIISFLSSEGELTTRELRRLCPEVPPATLYRQVARLLRGGILEVAREERTGGAVERTYRLAQDLLGDAEALQDPQEIRGLFYQFLIALLRDFQSYLGREDADLSRDGAGFRYTLLHLSDAEFAAFCRELSACVAKWESLGPGEERVQRRFSTVVVPVEDR